MPKQPITWRLEPTLIAQLEEEADFLGIDVTTLVEEKLGAKPQLNEILEIVRRLEKNIDGAF